MIGVLPSVAFPYSIFIFSQAHGGFVEQTVDDVASVANAAGSSTLAMMQRVSALNPSIVGQ